MNYKTFTLVSHHNDPDKPIYIIEECFDEMPGIKVIEKSAFDAAIEALKFYADRKNWRYTCGDDVSAHYDEIICSDSSNGCNGSRNYYGGVKARETLEQLGVKL